jgi:hypothetical protein
VRRGAFNFNKAALAVKHFLTQHHPETSTRLDRIRRFIAIQTTAKDEAREGYLTFHQINTEQSEKIARLADLLIQKYTGKHINEEYLIPAMVIMAAGFLVDAKITLVHEKKLSGVRNTILTIGEFFGILPLTSHTEKRLVRSVSPDCVFKKICILRPTAFVNRLLTKLSAPIPTASHPQEFTIPAPEPVHALPPSDSRYSLAIKVKGAEVRLLVYFQQARGWNNHAITVPEFQSVLRLWTDQIFTRMGLQAASGLVRNKILAAWYALEALQAIGPAAEGGYCLLRTPLEIMTTVQSLDPAISLIDPIPIIVEYLVARGGIDDIYGDLTLDAAIIQPVLTILESIGALQNGQLVLTDRFQLLQSARATSAVKN